MEAILAEAAAMPWRRRASEMSLGREGNTHAADWENQLATNDKEILTIRNKKLPKLTAEKKDLEAKLREVLKSVVVTWTDK